MKPHHHKYKNILLFILGFAVAFIITKIPWVNDTLLHLGKLKYLGAFFGGLLFTSTFTLPIGAIILLTLAKTLSPIILIPVAGVGAVLCDFFVFKFVKQSVDKEIEPIYEEVEKIIGKSHVRKIIHTKYFAWTLPVIGTFILASPLPDELGVSLMGLSDMSLAKFLVISWFSHTIGVFIIIGALG